MAGLERARADEVNSATKEARTGRVILEQEQLPDAATSITKITRNTERVGYGLYFYAALPFEIASLLLLVAIIGSVILARTSKQEIIADDLMVNDE